MAEGGKIIGDVDTPHHTKDALGEEEEEKGGGGG